MMHGFKHTNKDAPWINNYFPKKRALAVLFGIIFLTSMIYFSSADMTGKSAHRILLAEDSIQEAARMMHSDPKKTAVLLGIFSAAGAFQYSHRREYIRDTILDNRLEPRLCSLKEFIRQSEENLHKRVCQVAYTFVIGAGGDDRPTDHDDNEPLTVDNDLFGNSEDDCTYLNIRENMEDGKSPTYLKFGANIANQYGIDYIAKTDDDSVIGINALFNWIDSDLPPSPYNRRIYGGAPRLSRVKNTLYSAGEFYFMSADLADYVGNVLTAGDRLSLMNSRPIEDLDMGTFVFSNPHPIKMFNMHQRKVWMHPMKTEVAFRKMFLKSSDLPIVHPAIINWGNSCSHVIAGEGF